MNTSERGHPPSRPQPGPPPARGGPRRLEEPGAGAPREGNGGRSGATGRIPAGGAGIEPTASRGPRRLAKPRLVPVSEGPGGRPQKIGRREVDAVRESWLVEDRWWTDEPLRRRYWEVVTGDGRDLVVFRDLQEGRWYMQR